AALHRLSIVTRQGDGEVAQLRGAVVDVANGNGPAHHQRAMEAERRDRIHLPESPVGVEALDDLESVRDPVDGFENRRLVTRHRRGPREVQLDLRFDPWLEEVTDREPRVAVRGMVHGRVVDVAPDRRPHPVLGPDPAVGESDLATNGTLPARTAPS